MADNSRIKSQQFGMKVKFMEAVTPRFNLRGPKHFLSEFPTVGNSDKNSSRFKPILMLIRNKNSIVRLDNEIIAVV